MTASDNSICSLIASERYNVVTKEEMLNYYKGKYRERQNWKKSVNDDLESYLENMKTGELYREDARFTFFLSKLTERELKLLEDKNHEFLAMFDAEEDPDVPKLEMAKSESSSKFAYIQGYRSTESLNIETDLSPYLYDRRELLGPASLDSPP